MKKLILLFLPIILYSNAFSQYSYYAAAKAGLSIREQPGTSAAVLDKIPYGSKVNIVSDANQQSMSTEGFNGFWWKVNYNGKTGYIVSSYLLPMPPPKAGTKTMEEYFAQVSSKNGSALQLKRNDTTMNEMGESVLSKQLYKNGMEWHTWQGYESNTAVYMLPDFTLEQCFLLARLVNQWPEVLTDKDPFPSKNTTTKRDTGNKSVEVQREMFDGRPGAVNRFKFISEQGAITEIEFFMLDTQAVIFYSSGV
jgi:Bacterial SH3 domain